MRACQPVRDGYVERDGVKVSLRGLRCRRADGAAAADLVDHPLPALEAAGPVPGTALPRRHLRRARQRPLGPAGRARLPTREDEFAADTLAVMDATGTAAGRPGRRCLAGRAASAAASPRTTPSGSIGMVFIAPALPLRPAAPRSRAVQDFDERSRRIRGLGEVQPPLLARGLRGLPRVLLRDRCLTEPHSTKQHRGLPSDGDSRRTPRRWWRPQLARRLDGRARASVSCWPASTARCSSSTATRRRHPPLGVRRTTRGARERRARRCSTGPATCRTPATRSR